MRKNLFIVLIGILLVGISLLLFVVLYNVRADSTVINEDTNITETTLSNKKDVPSEITLDNEDGKIFNIPISLIPDLKSYLDAETDINTELERIKVDFLNWNISNDTYFLLKYGCGIKICNLVLIQITGLNEVNTAYLAEGIFTGSEIFENKAMFLIAVNEGNEVLRHQIILRDLLTMNPLHPIDKYDDENYFTSPLYPIK